MKILMNGQSTPVEMDDKAAQALIVAKQATLVTETPSGGYLKKATKQDFDNVTDYEKAFEEKAEKFPPSPFVINSLKLSAGEVFSGTPIANSKGFPVHRFARTNGNVTFYAKISLDKADAKGKPIAACVSLRDADAMRDYLDTIGEDWKTTKVAVEVVELDLRAGQKEAAQVFNFANAI